MIQRKKTLASAEDLAEIRGRVSAMTEFDQPRWGLMSAPEAVCHMREAFVIAMGQRVVSPLKAPLPRPVIKWLALSFPRPWPPNVPTVPELKQGGGVPAPALFADDLAGLQIKIDAFVALRENATPHAIFGAMCPADWMRWGYLHTDHHLRQFGR